MVNTGLSALQYTGSDKKHDIKMTFWYHVDDIEILDMFDHDDCVVQIWPETWTLLTEFKSKTLFKIKVKITFIASVHKALKASNWPSAEACPRSYCCYTYQTFCTLFFFLFSFQHKINFTNNGDRFTT